MGIYSYGFGQNKHLVVRQQDPKTPKKAPEPVSVDHVFCIDVSGSMSSELPTLRDHLKNKVIKMVQPGDTLSLVWFSGRGQHGTLLTEQAISGLLDVKEVHDLIDRFLHPIGMTGFKEPLEDCKRVWETLRSKRPHALSSLLFMSDGCDNQWTHQEIFAALDQIYGKFQAATFVEYGYYADRKLLTAMAEKMGGTVVLAEDFPSFAPMVEKAITETPGRAFHKLEVPGCRDFAFTLTSSGELQVFGVADGVVMVPVDPDTSEVACDLFWVSDSVVGNASTPVAEASLSDVARKAAYTALSAYGYRMRGDVVKPLLLDLRDPDLLRAFSTCFGKQRYTDFSVQAAHRAAWAGDAARVSADVVKNYFRTDLPTVIDLFDLLMDVEASALLVSGLFKYERISVKTETAADALKFVPDAAEGYPIAGLTLNENRANISMRVKKNGYLDLDVEGKPKGLPSTIRAFQWRNYSLVADGVVHIDLLPVTIAHDRYDAFRSHPLYQRFSDMGVIKGVAAKDGLFEVMLDLTPVGLTNESLSGQPSAKTLLDKELELLSARIDQKVFNHYKKLHGKDAVDPALSAVLGAEEAKWLYDKGFRAGLYQPQTAKAEATDVYKGVELQTSIKSFNTLPKIEEVLERKKAGKKLTPSMEVMLPVVERCEAASKSMKTVEFQGFIDAEAKRATLAARRALSGVARHKFAVLMGQTWFSEATAAGELSMTVGYGGRDYDCSVKLVDVDIAV